MAVTSIQLATFTDARTVSAAHLVRFITAERALRNMPDATDEEVAAEITKDCFARWKSRVLAYEQGKAAKTASDAITEITLS